MKTPNRHSLQHAFTAGAVLLILASGCQSAADPTVPTATKGTLKVRAYSAVYTDPSTITADAKINAILEVTYPNKTTATIVTDDLGYYNFGSLTAGEYTIQPRYSAASEAKTFKVEDEKATTGEFVIPKTGLGYYTLNPAKTPLDDAAVRQALLKAVDRAKLRTAGAVTGPAVFSVIPGGISGDWSASAHSATESLTDAQTALAGKNFSVALLFNDATNVNNLAAELQTEWQQVSGVTVTLNKQQFNDFLALRDTDQNYQAARSGWVLDSNNPLSLFNAINNSISDTDYSALLVTAKNDLRARKMTEFDADIVALNDYLIDNAIILPLYDYN